MSQCRNSHAPGLFLKVASGTMDRAREEIRKVPLLYLGTLAGIVAATILGMTIFYRSTPPQNLHAARGTFSPAEGYRSSVAAGPFGP